MRVAVYGTLKRGMVNHPLLIGSRFLGDDWLMNIVLYDLDEFPAARLGESDGIHVEIYDVSKEVLLSLDTLEEVNHEIPEKGLYRRVQSPTRFGMAWIYLYNGIVDGLEKLNAGSWRPH